MSEFYSIFNKRKKFIDENILSFVPKHPIYGGKLYDAVRYALLGGKRLRAILLMSSYELFGGNYRDVLCPACAVEMIHAYSLVHDDLPAMDNDTLRRGHSSTWAKFGESTAILAGDALLNRAFEILSNWNYDNDRKIRVISEISKASGMIGMVLGQQCDMDAEEKSISLDELLFIHKHKTGQLIKASVISGGILGGANKNKLNLLEAYAENIGLAFQIIDDVLDVTSDSKTLGKNANSDDNNKKATFVTFFGVDGAIKMAKDLVDKAVGFTSSIDGAEFLSNLAYFILNRRY